MDSKFWFLLIYCIDFNNGFWWAEGKPIPTELRNEEAALRQQIDLEDEHTAGMLRRFLVFKTCFWYKARLFFCLFY